MLARSRRPDSASASAARSRSARCSPRMYWPMSVHSRRLADGRVVYDVRLRGPSGRQYKRTFRTKAEAVNFAAEERSARTKGTWVDPLEGKVRLDISATSWLRTRVGLRPRTVDLYEVTLRRLVLPELGKNEIGDISSSQVRTWYASLFEKRVSLSRPAPRRTDFCEPSWPRQSRARSVAGPLPLPPPPSRSWPGTSSVTPGEDRMAGCSTVRTADPCAVPCSTGRGIRHAERRVYPICTSTTCATPGTPWLPPPGRAPGSSWPGWDTQAPRPLCGTSTPPGTVTSPSPRVSTPW